MIPPRSRRTKDITIRWMEEVHVVTLFGEHFCPEVSFYHDDDFDESSS